MKMAAYQIQFGANASLLTGNRMYSHAMRNDKTTLHDLSVFSTDGSVGIFDLLNHTTTHAGRESLRRMVTTPPDNLPQLQETQDVVRFWTLHPDLWPSRVLNGTLVMIDKYFESADYAPAPPSGLVAWLTGALQRLLNRREYFFTQFSLSHLADLFRGCAELVALPGKYPVPPLLEREIQIMKEELRHDLAEKLVRVTKFTSHRELLVLNYRARRELKNPVMRLVKSYALLDAWRSLALATREHRWTFPDLLPEKPVCFEARSLFHPLLGNPVAYDLSLNEGQNFLLLTGANMSGKTTLLRTLGVTALLAHLGAGVPAASLRISFLQGIITNMHVEDNILKGESYFFAEVQRMKQTAEKLTRNQPHLVLMDELFKGTNVHDACDCTRAVIEGLLKHPDHLMVLSTHLYEVALHFQSYTDIRFANFVTRTAPDGGFEFTYRLAPGISNDRIGFRILQQEGVLALLQKTASA